MSHCHHHTPDIITFDAMGEYGIILSLFLIGLSGSFSHCIGMCGPIALSIGNLRMLTCESLPQSESTRFKIAFCLPYYLGKTCTYSILGLLFYLTKEMLADIPLMKSVASAFLILCAISFAFMGISGSVSLGIKLPKPLLKFQKWISVEVVDKLSPFGFKGFLQGMVLGLIPCGLVINSIILATASSQNALICTSAMMAFGLATIPGLFLVTYLGTSVFRMKFKRVIKLFYSIVMLISAYQMLKYALKLL